MDESPQVGLPIRQSQGAGLGMARGSAVAGARGRAEREGERQ